MTFGTYPRKHIIGEIRHLCRIPNARVRCYEEISIIDLVTRFMQEAYGMKAGVIQSENIRLQ